MINKNTTLVIPTPRFLEGRLCGGIPFFIYLKQGISLFRFAPIEMTKPFLI